MSKKITLNNIRNYIDGNTRMHMGKLGLNPAHIQEQIAYRLLTCKDDCVIEGACKVCTCPLPNRAFSKESCNQDRFPDLIVVS